MRTFVLAFFILCCGSSFIESANINCEFKNASSPILGKVDNCIAENEGDIITSRTNRHFNTINGELSTNPSVKVVIIANSNCFYFPLGLEKLFPNLEGINIHVSKLKEIRREDFKNYQNLRILGLSGNEIQFLEPNLFEFVPKLEAIKLDNNEIAHIDAKVFDNFVGKLNHLLLTYNICEFENAWDYTSKVNETIKKVQSGSCINETLLPTTTSTT